MLSDARFREWRTLGKAKYRKKTGLFVAEGLRTIQQILQNGSIRVVALVSAPSRSPQVDDLISKLWKQASERWGNVTLHQADPAQWKELSETETPQPLLAICEVPVPVQPEVLFEEPFLEDTVRKRENRRPILALDAIQDPGNLGTILRTAAWFGIQGIICGEGTVDPWNPKVVRSTAGSTGQIPLVFGSLHHALDQAVSAGWSVVALDAGEDGRSVALPEFQFPEKTVLLVGNEANGISPEILRKAEVVCRIPGFTPSGIEGVESLNAAMALGIAMYACVSQAPTSTDSSTDPPASSSAR